MGIARTRPWDAAAHLRSEDDVIAYLNAVLAENDPELTVAALSDAVRALGKEAVAAEAGLIPGEISINDNPGFASILEMLDALGLRLHAVPAQQ